MKWERLRGVRTIRLRAPETERWCSSSSIARQSFSYRLDLKALQLLHIASLLLESARCKEVMTNRRKLPDTNQLCSARRYPLSTANKYSRYLRTSKVLGCMLILTIIQVQCSKTEQRIDAILLPEPSSWRVFLVHHIQRVGRNFPKCFNILIHSHTALDCL
jgi:hypothetical protein